MPSCQTEYTSKRRVWLIILSVLLRSLFTTNKKKVCSKNKGPPEPLLLEQVKPHCLTTQTPPFDGQQGDYVWGLFATFHQLSFCLNEGITLWKTPQTDKHKQNSQIGYLVTPYCCRSVLCADRVSLPQGDVCFVLKSALAAKGSGAGCFVLLG